MNQHATRLGRSLVRATALPGLALMLCSPGAFAAAHSFVTAPAYPSTLARPTADITVSGFVADSRSTPLPGVSVVVKGSTLGTTTDTDGKFSLQVPAGSTLVFTYIGYAKQELVVSEARSNISVKLNEDAAALNDVVVVGYGEQKRETLTGAIATVGSKMFQDRGVVDNPLAALQGQVPGVVVTRSSAAPGRAAWNFNIRGASSITSSQPLIVIDGIPVSDNNALNSINPNDIENISFLKDASAAIYGARAANGAVLITTKTAKAGKMVLQYDGSVSRKVLGLQPHLINVQQFGQGLIDGTTNDYYGVAPTSFIWYRLGQLMVNPPASGYIDLTNGNTVNPSTNPLNPGFGDVKDLPFFDTNAVDILWGSAISTQHNVSLSGRSDKAGYRVSLGYLNDGSQLKWGKNSNARYNLRATTDYSFSDRVKLETNLSLERNDIVQPTNTGYLGQYSQPGFPVSTIDGKPYAWGTQYSPNWQAELGGDNIESNTRIFTNLRLTTELVKNLRWVNQVGYNWTLQNLSQQNKGISWYNYLGDLQYPDNPTRANTYYQREQRKDAYATLNSYLNYAKTFKEAHTVSLTVGAAYERDEYAGFLTRTSNIANDNVPSLGLGIGDATTKTNSETQNHYAIGSAFGRFNYAFHDRYLLEVIARTDGSSKFRPEDRWKFFSSVSGGWRITEESFLKDKYSWLNEIKLRASYGTSGNPGGIGLYDYLQQLTVRSSSGQTDSGTPIIGSSPVVYVAPTSTLVSLTRTWERVQNYNVGLDIALLNRRLTGSVDFFQKYNRNMLVPNITPGVLGATAPAENRGGLKVWGWEAALNWQDRIGSVGYRIGGSITDNQNRLFSYNGVSLVNANNSNFNAQVEGYPLGSYFGLEYAGRIQTDEQRRAAQALATGSDRFVPIPNSSGIGGVRIGDNSFVDRNGDGKLTGQLADGSLGDLKFLGTDNPRYTYAINLGADWHGFDFTAVFQGVGQRTIFREGNWRVPFGSIFQGQTDFWVGDTWTPSNTGATYPILSTGQNGTQYNTYNYQISDWSVQNGAYIRLKNLVLGYSLPESISKRVGASRIRVYYAGSDIWEHTNIKDGWDPEATRSVGRANSESTFTRYPFFRLHTAGVNFTF